MEAAAKALKEGAGDAGDGSAAENAGAVARPKQSAAASKRAKGKDEEAPEAAAAKKPRKK